MEISVLGRICLTSCSHEADKPNVSDHHRIIWIVDHFSRTKSRFSSM